MSTDSHDLASTRSLARTRNAHAVRPGTSGDGPTPRPTGSCVVCCAAGRRAQRASAAEARKAFQTSIAVATVRCLLMYIVFPFVLPAVGRRQRGGAGRRPDHQSWWPSWRS
jgi:hypothetical protein